MLSHEAVWGLAPLFYALDLVLNISVQLAQTVNGLLICLPVTAAVGFQKGGHLRKRKQISDIDIESKKRKDVN